jgi:hypothetical protein
MAPRFLPQYIQEPQKLQKKHQKMLQGSFVKFGDFFVLFEWTFELFEGFFAMFGVFVFF